MPMLSLRTSLPVLAAAAMMLAGCQGAPEPAERAQPAEQVPAVTPTEADACWAQARLVRADGQADDRLFAVPCPATATPAFWASVQRALAVRGLYAGPVTGVPDAATEAAVRRWQAPLGLDSPILSMDGARYLGLIAWPRDRL